MLNSSSPTEIIEFRLSIKPEKHIDLSNSSSPRLRIADERSDTRFIICSQKKKEQFIKIPYKINLKKKDSGL